MVRASSTTGVVSCRDRVFGIQPDKSHRLINPFASEPTQQEMNLVTGFPCPCCGFLTLSEQPPGTFSICPVCSWEDDNVQYADPAYEGGANGLSLNQARANFRDFGARCGADRSRVRAPRPDETPDNLP
jgi:hypothetical protein